MAGSDFGPAAAFIVLITLVYALATHAAVKLVRTRKLASLLTVQWVAVALAILGTLCIAYGFFIEPNRLTTSHIEISSPKVAVGSGAIRIAHFSDLHSGRRPRLEPRLVAAVAAERPDLIVFTGDAMNTKEAMPVMRECLAGMAKIAPTFVVRGNWDTSYWWRTPLFDQTGVQELNGAVVRTEVRGTPIWVAGLSFVNEEAMKKTVAEIPPNEFSLFLYHSPDLMPQAVGSHLDLYLAGHTHGGQVALPFYGAIITLSRFGKRYESGLFHEKDTWLYVNRGIGMAGDYAPPVRFWAPPELTIIDVRPAP
jgi:uncharacterized protein